jgi:hypothetical protein
MVHRFQRGEANRRRSAVSHRSEVSMRHAFPLLLLLGLTAPVAHAEPWLCTFPDGHKEFSYDAGSAGNRDCVDQPISRGYVRRPPPLGPYASPAEFPRIDSKTQKKRDVARREILERELEAERKSLAGAMRELAEIKQARVAPAMVKQYEERIRVHQSNIASLQRELAGAG